MDGVKHNVFAALTPTDSWHASHGFAGDGEMEMVTFKKSGGIHPTHVFNVPQPQVAPEVRIGSNTPTKTANPMSALRRRR